MREGLHGLANTFNRAIGADQQQERDRQRTLQREQERQKEIEQQRERMPDRDRGLSL